MLPGVPRVGASFVAAPAQARSSPHLSALFRPCSRPSERVPAGSVPWKLLPAPLEAVAAGASKAAGGGFDGTERAGTRSDGRKQGRSSADGCGEDRASGHPGRRARGAAPARAARCRLAAGAGRLCRQGAPILCRLRSGAGAGPRHHVTAPAAFLSPALIKTNGRPAGDLTDPFLLVGATEHSSKLDGRRRRRRRRRRRWAVGTKARRWSVVWRLDLTWTDLSSPVARPWRPGATPAGCAAGSSLH